ncbi:hypothetical protein BGLA2_700028 [Burkholderia gladioli]|nr:hypothetical protein BGLA2_700028 [Burkholderia gladioli]
MVDRSSGPYTLVMVYGEIEGVLSAGVQSVRHVPQENASSGLILAIHKVRVYGEDPVRTGRGLWGCRVKVILIPLRS